MSSDTPARAAYRALCRAEPIPLFSQDWWLDAVCGPAAWDAVVIEKGGQVAGAWPFHWREHWLFGRRVTMPPLTQTMGPWLRYPPSQKASTRLGHEAELIPALLDAMPRFASFRQNLHHGLSNWLPLCWRGFRQTTRYTYILPPATDMASVFQQFDGKIRTDIRKAEKILKVVETDDIGRLIRLNAMTFARQGMLAPIPAELIATVDRACAARGARRLTIGVDEQGRDHGAVYVAWHGQTTYYLMSGADTSLRGSSVGTLLLWDAIRFALGRGQSFDFEGSMIEPIERFFRAFGSLQTPYSQVWRSTRTARLWEAVGLR